MEKRICALAAALILALTLTACGDTGSTKPDTNKDPNTTPNGSPSTQPDTNGAVPGDDPERVDGSDASAAAGRIAMTCRLSGGTPDIYLLDDLTKKELPDYKLWIVADPQTLTEAQLKTWNRRTSRKGCGI